MLNKGLMIPSPASPARSANNPRPITIIPADLKKSGACFECANDTEPNESNASIGNVPSANENIMRSPDINDPLESAATCIDWVNPHGKKNVPKPMISGVSVLCSIFLKKLKIAGDKAILFFANTPTKFKPRSIITADAVIPSIAVNVKLIPMAFPINPRTPPKIVKLTSLPTWKSTKFFCLWRLSPIGKEQAHQQ